MVARDWEAQFRQWASPPGKTEKTRCDNAASAIRNAINASETLKARGISVFAQGSYRNNTNVRKNSDVDIGIVCTDTFFYDLPEGFTKEQFRITPATYQYYEFKNDVETALGNYFGRKAVTRGNKSFDIHETSYHVEADLAPFFEHRRFRASGDALKGVELQPDNGSARIINWPEQHYENGVQKNIDTGTRYKSIVRVLKALSNEMTVAKIPEGSIPGFLIECLVWNVPNSYFQNEKYTDDVRESLISLYHNTKEEAPCKEWGEVNELKYLFRPTQKWTREQANSFVLAAWNYAGFGN